MDPSVEQVPQLRAAGSSGPTGRSCRGTRRSAPSRGPSPRRAAPRRSGRRSQAPRSPPAASPTARRSATQARAAASRCPARSSPRPSGRSAAPRAPRRARRGTGAPRGSCGRCRCAAAGTAAAPAGTPSRRAAGRRSYLCRPRTAGPASRSGPRPRGGCRSLRIRATPGDRGAYCQPSELCCSCRLPTHERVIADQRLGIPEKHDRIFPQFPRPSKQRGVPPTCHRLRPVGYTTVAYRWYRLRPMRDESVMRRRSWTSGLGEACRLARQFWRLVRSRFASDEAIGTVTRVSAEPPAC